MGFGNWISVVGGKIATNASDAASYMTSGHVMSDVGDGIVSGATSVKNGVISGASAVASGASTAWNWTADTAAPWVGNSAINIVAIPVGIVLAGTDVVSREVFGSDWISDTTQTVTERANRIAQPINNFGSYAYDNPARATALATQGVVNGVTSLGGLASDIVKFTIWDATARNVVNLSSGVLNGAYNLGIEDEAEKADWHQDWDKFLYFSEKFNNNTQIKDLPEGLTDFVGIDRKGFEGNFGNIKDEVLLEDGTYSPNPDASYERVLLYGPQAVSETVAIVLIGPPTLGFGSAALASLRLGTVATKTATFVGNMVEKVPLVGKITVDATKTISTAIGNKVNLTSRSLGTAEQVKQADMAHDTATAMEKISIAEAKAMAQAAKAEAKLEAAKLQISNSEAIAQAGGKAELTAQTETQLEIAKAELIKLETAKAEIAKLEIAKAEIIRLEAIKVELAAQTEINVETARLNVTAAEESLAAVQAQGAEQIATVTAKANQATANLRLSTKLDKAVDNVDDAVKALSKTEAGTAEHAAATQALGNARGDLIKLVDGDGFWTKIANKIGMRPEVEQLLNGVEEMAKNVNRAKTSLSEAKTASKIAGKELNVIKKTGSADEIAAAENKLSEAKDTVISSKEALSIARAETKVGLENVSSEIQQLGYLENITESYKIGHYKAMQRWLNLRDHPWIEGTAMAGAAALGIHVAETTSQTQLDGQTQARDALKDATNDKLNDLSNDRGFFAPPQTSKKGSNLTQEFGGTTPQANNVGSFSGNENATSTGMTSTEFNNRSEALVTALPDGGGFNFHVTQAQANLIKALSA